MHFRLSTTLANPASRKRLVVERNGPKFVQALRLQCAMTIMTIFATFSVICGKTLDECTMIPYGDHSALQT